MLQHEQTLGIGWRKDLRAKLVRKSMQVSGCQQRGRGRDASA